MSKRAKIIIGILVLAVIAGCIYYFGFYKKDSATEKPAEASTDSTSVSVKTTVPINATKEASVLDIKAERV